MDIKETLLNLSKLCGIGTVKEASEYAASILKNYCEVSEENGLTVVGEIKGNSDYTLILDAHIDEVGFIVTNISESGFLTVAKCGGIDLRHLPAKEVTVHTKSGKIPAVFVSTPPHLSHSDTVNKEIGDYKIDSLLGSLATSIISVGDFVTYRSLTSELLNGRLAGKSFDDRAGVVCLIELARRLKNKPLACNVKFLLSDAEELGLRGAKTSAFKHNADAAIAIDVSFGDGPDIKSSECGKLGEGAMIGISPVLDREITDKLTAIANHKAIPHQLEVMGGKTGTNADVISVTKSGIRTGLLSIPLRNMHTDNEIIDISDIISVCDILEEYILSGGVMSGK